MELLKKIKNSIYGPDYYRELIGRPFSYTVKYYLSFILLIAFLITLILLFTVAPQFKSFIDTSLKNIIDKYPSNLEIVIKDGKVSTNSEEVVKINGPSDWRGGMDHFLVIDTKNQFSMEAFNNYRTICLLTETEFVCPDNNGALQITPVKNFPDYTINKTTVSFFSQKISSMLKFLYPFFAVFVLLGVFLGYLFRLIYMLLLAFAIWIIAKIKKTGIGYWKSYQLGMHLMTLPIIVTFLINYLLKLMVPDFQIPYLFTILLLVAAILNLKSRAALSVPQPPSPPMVQQ